MTGDNMKDHALHYARLGLAVFPIRPRSKQPLTAHGFKDASKDQQHIDQWWSRWPDANIGIATGSVSGGLVVIDLDIDDTKGIDGRVTLREWEAQHGKLPDDTWVAITGRGGCHYFYHDTSIVRNRTGIYKGIDVRGEGGYIVAPPSVHPNGNTYIWEQDPILYSLAEANGIVFNFLNPPVISERKSFRMPEQMPKQIPEGERTSALISMIGSSKAKGWSDKAIRSAIRSENEARCTPPLTDDELEKFVFPALNRGWEVTAPYYQSSSGMNGEDGEFRDIRYFRKPDATLLSPFPVEVLPPVLKNYVIEVANSLQVSVDMVAVSVMGIIAACTQGTFFIEPKPDWQEPLNLYILTVAKPSERKTPTLKEVTKPIYDYVAAENVRRMPIYNEYLVKKKVLSGKVDTLMKKASSSTKKGSSADTVGVQEVVAAQMELEELEEVTLMKLLVDDITPEAMVRVMKENEERISIMTAEGGIFGMLAGRYSNQPNMDIFLKAYSGERYSTERVTRKSEDLDHPLLTLNIMVQPIVLQEAMQNREFRERGLLARFLYSIPVSRVGNRVYDSMPINEKHRQAYRDLVEELLSIGSHGWQLEENVIHLSEGAYKASEDFFNEIERRLVEEFEEIEDWAGKYHGQTMRIAGLLHTVYNMLDAPGVLLDEQTMKDAIQIGRYFLEHAKMAFQISGIGIPQSEKDAKYIMKRIESYFSEAGPKKPNNPNNMLKQELWQRCRGHFEKMENMQPGLDELEERNYIRITKQSSGGRGRPSEIIEINPEYWNQKEISHE
ncbi:bifunctional DNA primase/polymerase family protein [Clostridium sp. ASBs410]|nr:bifunctional DNA primase/polymerase family protein [Clostridium sp. ASBs410]